jgi:hypothetical protein
MSPSSGARKGFANLTPAQKRSFSAERVSRSPSLPDREATPKRPKRAEDLYTMSKAIKCLQEQIVAASKLAEVRYNKQESLADNVANFSLERISQAIQRAAPDVFSLLTGAYLKCARSGRARGDHETADAQKSATVALINFLKNCNQLCNATSRVTTVALMGKGAGKAVCAVELCNALFTCMLVYCMFAHPILPRSRCNCCICLASAMTGLASLPWRRRRPSW